MATDAENAEEATPDPDVPEAPSAEVDPPKETPEEDSEAPPEESDSPPARRSLDQIFDSVAGEDWVDPEAAEDATEEPPEAAPEEEKDEAPAPAAAAATVAEEAPDPPPDLEHTIPESGARTITDIVRLATSGKMGQLTPQERQQYEEMRDPIVRQQQAQATFAQEHAALGQADQGGNLHQAAAQLAQKWNRPLSAVYAFYEEFKPEQGVGAAYNAEQAIEQGRTAERQSLVSTMVDSAAALAKKLEIPDAKLTELRTSNQNALSLYDAIATEGARVATQKAIDTRLPKLAEQERKAASREKSVTQIKNARMPRVLPAGAVAEKPTGRRSVGQIYDGVAKRVDTER